MRRFVTKPKNVLDDIICDVCSRSCKTPLADFEHATVSADWGYSSRKDGQQTRIDLCESCFDTIINHIYTLRDRHKQATSEHDQPQ